jgi:2-octaprenylphenol hydroxylase
MNVPIIISGGGIIGNYISVRLKRHNIESLIIEKSSETQDYSEGIRTLTLNNHSLSLLQKEQIEVETAPIDQINALDGEGTGRIKFLSDDIGENFLSHVVMFNELKNKLAKACHERTIFDNQIESIQSFNQNHTNEVLLSNGSSIEGQIIAGCDGRKSNVAKISNLSNKSSEYNQTAITFICKADKNFDRKTAHQVFSEKGIFAVMPMPERESMDNRCTIVWSVNNKNLEGLSINDFVSYNLSFFESKLGIKLKIDSQLLHFQLSNHHFENYINNSIVLIGDAAHSIHPLAGQGINLGFADADIFCEEVVGAYNKGMAINEASVLKKYEIRRKGMNLLMLKSMDFFVYFFNDNNSYIRLLRNWGLKTVNRTSFIKAFFTRHASGLNKI